MRPTVELLPIRPSRRDSNAILATAARRGSGVHQVGLKQSGILQSENSVNRINSPIHRGARHIALNDLQSTAASSYGSIAFHALPFPTTAPHGTIGSGQSVLGDRSALRIRS